MTTTDSRRGAWCPICRELVPSPVSFIPESTAFVFAHLFGDGEMHGVQLVTVTTTTEDNGDTCTTYTELPAAELAALVEQGRGFFGLAAPGGGANV